MHIFKLHDADSAPKDSLPLLEKSLKAFGMIPNLHAVMAEAPGLLNAYQRLHDLVLESSFTTDEKTVVWQTINVEHECHYCVPAHTFIANNMGVETSISDALRNKTPLPTQKLETLRGFTLCVIRKRGDVDTAELESFFDAGFSKRQALEIILILSQKVMSNYVNQFVDTPIDEPFARFKWK